MCFRKLGIFFKLLDQAIICFRLFDSKPGKEWDKKSIATMGMLSGAEEITQSWCQSWTAHREKSTTTTTTPRVINLPLLKLNLRFAISYCPTHFSLSLLLAPYSTVSGSLRQRQTKVCRTSKTTSS